MKKILGIMIVLGAILVSNIVVDMPLAHAAYWCDWCNERGVCHERNVDCPYWQDGQQGQASGASSSCNSLSVVNSI